MKVKTPKELAQVEKKGKKGYNLYLDESNMDEVAKYAGEAGISPSKVVNEAISFYLRTIKVKK